jgi:putative ABC transport system permease protein
MNLIENIKVALSSIRENSLRTTLTALIIAIGIFALVGILTAVEGIQTSINSSFADLGANSFDVEQKNSQKNRRRGRDVKQFPPIEYHQAIDFKERMSLSGSVCLSAIVSFNAEVKFGSKKTNPNTAVYGGDENYLAKAGLNLQSGRNFSMSELQSGATVVILGSSLVETIFDKQNPINQMITMQGAKYKVIGVLEKKGSNFGGGGDDRSAIVPLENARVIAPMQLTFDISTLPK